MSKLWIVHRHAARREALARICGLPVDQIVCDQPTSEVFADRPPPAALLLGVETDPELELDFCHRHRHALARTRRLILTTPELAPALPELFGASTRELSVGVPDERALRGFVVSATAHREAESLAERSARARIAARFSAWLGGLEVPGLLRALDPSLAGLPLLVRGVPGSGRRLLCRYVELFRGSGRPTLRLHASEIPSIDVVEARLAARSLADLPSFRTLWIDEIDALPRSVQRGLADWIRIGAAPGEPVATGIRWIATAGPSALEDALEPSLARVFAPLEIEVPALAENLESLPAFTEGIIADWSASVRGPTRRLTPQAIEALAAHAWPGDREAIEAILRKTLAATTRDPIEPADLALAISPVPAAEAEATAPALEVEAEPTPIAPTGERPADVPAAAPRSEASEPDPSVAMMEETFGLGPDPGLAGSGESAGPSTAAPSTLQTEDTMRTPATARAGAGANDELRASESWRRLARSLSHEIRNPLVSIRTFAELLPDHFEDPEFRARFTELVGRDVSHIDEVVTRLADAARTEKLEAGPVDVSELIEELLDARRDAIARDRLLVLRELEREAPIALADPHALKAALAGLLDRALASLPERGDLFVATRRIDRAADGEPRLRVLLRHHNPDLRAGAGEPLAGELHPDANALEYVLAETIVGACGGRLTLDTTDALETLILVDLRTPA